MIEEQLKELGLDKAADRIIKKKELKRKLTLAYEHYKFVTPVMIDKFQKALKEKTVKEEEYSSTYDKLIFIELAQYGEIPPPDCLMDLKKAKDHKIFDSFEVAKVESIVERKDPIIFGLIQGCDDKFFITQWDDDVSIEEIIDGNN